MAEKKIFYGPNGRRLPEDKDSVHLRIQVGPKTHTKTLLKMLNHYGLKGWKWFSTYEGKTYHIYHFRKPESK